jgi:hypothetical protein
MLSSMFVLILLHYYAIFFAGAIVLALIIIKWSQPSFRHIIAKLIATIAFAIALLSPLLSGQIGHEDGSTMAYLIDKWFPGIFYSPIKVLIGSFIYKKNSLSEINRFDLLGIIPSLFILLMTVISLLSQYIKGKLSESVKIIFLSVVFAFIFHIATGWKIPSIHPRYMIGFLILLFGLAIIASKRDTLLQYVVVIFFLTINGFGLFNHYNRTFPYIEPWKEISKFTEYSTNEISADIEPIIADFMICNTLAFYMKDTEVQFYSMNPDMEEFKCARLNLFGHDFFTNICTDKFFSEDTTISFDALIVDKKHGFYISKDVSSAESHKMLVSTLGSIADFDLIKVFPTNQGQVSIFKWKYNGSDADQKYRDHDNQLTISKNQDDTDISKPD